MITFSIIIPTFNSEESLSVSLASIANQTFKDVEVLIMDGASTDDTVAVAKSFQESLPNLAVYSEKDTGIYDAMNKGIHCSNGAWLYFMGSDDRLHADDTLEKLNTILSETKAHVVYGNAEIEGDTGWANDGTLYDGPFDLPKLLNKNICHQAMLYRSRFIKDVVGLFDTRYRVVSDWDLNLRCWARSPFQYIDQTIAYFAAGGVSTEGIDEAFAKDRVDNILRYFNIGLFNALVNTPMFQCYHEVKRRQRAQAPLRYYFSKMLQK
ncbi:glycosyltransferase family 2 protein [Altibacter sp.]|uniref:glycosyltransferase family 2 protein n=1 Tax=Altibacter sp. TaxID=2024823 RepID=UPI000C934F2B|nr:glycosyltransferase family 2 protein [Altibacter sp.]MAP55646.1 glycosyl transferase [Altibacter sp.]